MAFPHSAALTALALLGAGCSPDPLDITIENMTPYPISGLVLVPAGGVPLSIPQIAAGESCAVRPSFGSGESHLVLVDSFELRYMVLPYFEGNPGGELAIVLEGCDSTGLSGRIVDRTHYAPSGESPLQRLR
jgi:hypothetical protein